MNYSVRTALGIFLVSTAVVPVSLAAPQVTVERRPEDASFKLGSIPEPSGNDAATKAKFTIVDGEGSNLSALNDGHLPTEADAPQDNFIFKDGEDGGRIQVDLGQPTVIGSINSYSWHPTTRATQSYRLWGAKGDEKNFQESPKRGSDPRSLGWKAIIAVATANSSAGGQHAATITDPRTLNLGEFRYLLFDFDSVDSDKNTYLSEIDIIDAKATEAPKAPGLKPVMTYQTEDKKYKFTVDSTIAPDLGKWADKELMPVVLEWYPKIVDLLPSKKYTAPDDVILEFRDDLGGTPAYAIGAKVCMSIPFFKGQLEGEAKGCVIHELVHVIQNYWRASTTNPNPQPTPGWVSEGIPDYIRFFIFEPEIKGAEIHSGNFANSKFDGSYRTSANFLNWVVTTHDATFIQKLNAAAREGNYSEKIWVEATGKTPEQLGEDWREANKKRLKL